jgi:uncharacterized membrane protein YfcA
MWQTPGLAAALGAAVGLILALTGAGGGILAVPLLVFALDMTMQQAVPVGLIAVGLAAAVGAALGLREGNVRYRAAALIAASGMALAPLGVWIGQRVPNPPLLIGFAAVLVLVAWRMLQQSRHRAPAGSSQPFRRDPPCVVNPASGRLRWTLPCARVLAATGMLSGLLCGLLGLGGGFVIVPALTRNSDLDARSIVSTSLAVICLVSVSGVAAAAVDGAVRWGIALPFGGGAVAALALGRRITRQMAGARLQQGFALVSITVAVLLLLRGLGIVHG